MKKILTILTMLVLLLTSCEQDYKVQPTKENAPKTYQRARPERHPSECDVDIIARTGLGMMSNYKVVKLTFKDTVIYQAVVTYDGDNGGAAIANINYKGK